MNRSFRNLFSSTGAVVATGIAIGVLAPILQKLGNPGNMGICVACFKRDIAGAIGLHRAGVVQYLRPEIIGMALGAWVGAMASGEFRPRGGSSPIVRFVLGFFAMIGALVFLGCPWRALLRLSAGDWNAVVGILGLIMGIAGGTLFLRAGFSLGRSTSTRVFAGWIFPMMMLGLLVLRIACPPVADSTTSGVLSYSPKGPGAMHAPLVISLAIGLVIGVIAQRSRFCTVGAFRDMILFRQPHLLWGVLALVLAALAANLAMSQFRVGFENQPVAHSRHMWNFAGMGLAGLAFALAGGCPGRQLFMTGEGDNDAAMCVVGMLFGGALAHNFGLASSPRGPGPHTAMAVVVGLTVCCLIGFMMRVPTQQGGK